MTETPALLGALQNRHRWGLRLNPIILCSPFHLFLSFYSGLDGRSPQSGLGFCWEAARVLSVPIPSRVSFWSCWYQNSYLAEYIVGWPSQATVLAKVCFLQQRTLTDTNSSLSQQRKASSFEQYTNTWRLRGKGSTIPGRGTQYARARQDENKRKPIMLEF